MLKISVGFIICILTVLCCGSSFAQEPNRERHDKELLFGISGLNNISLNSFGGEFGFRYFVSKNFALRPSFTFSKRESKYTEYRENYSDPYHKEEVARFDLVLEHFLEPHDRLSPYYGLGFSMENSSYEESRSLPEPLTPGFQTKRTTTGDQNSIMIVLGTQWQISNAINIGCEYKIQYGKQERKNESTYFEEESRITEDTFTNFNAYSSSFYLSLLF